MEDTDIKFLRQLADYFDSLRSDESQGLTTDAYAAAKCRKIAARLEALAIPAEEKP